MHPTESAASPGARRSLRGGPSPLPVEFYRRPSDTVARELLGMRIVSEIGGVRVAGEIVETEAYVGPHDAASHAAERFGRTHRNDPMFGPPGTLYVYLIYGVHWCANVVTDAEEYPAAVLLRAAEPVEGLDAIRERRAGRPDRELMRGPGNLARALGITGQHNRHPMDRPPLWIQPGREVPIEAMNAGPRIGITRAVDWPLRFWVAGDPHVSRSV
ncbi:MAG TPA: DNA-3-methyladenine glycosylase [Longimicrobium sp.]|nr:DNA-3-methyladenine glycosylase [Longimicrobium sp.]